MTTAKPTMFVTVASAMTVHAFLRNHLEAASDRYVVHLLGRDLSTSLEADEADGVVIHDVPIARSISPVDDIRALVLLTRLIRLHRPDISLSYTPKAGLLAALAARSCGVSVRVHTFTGQVWATRRGAGRRLLRFIDTVTSRCTTLQLVDSRSQRRFLVEEGVLRPGEGEVLGSGSVAGVNLARFGGSATLNRRQEVRDDLGIPPDALAVVFVGRMAADKGLLELVDAYVVALKSAPHAWLIVAGPDEAGLAEELRRRLCDHTDRFTILADMISAPELLFAAGDLAVLPSRREGFGVTVLEAAAAGLPTVASRIYGITDAVLDGETGVLYTLGDQTEFASSLERLLLDESERLRLGRRARERVRSSFVDDDVTELLMWRLGVARPDTEASPVQA